MHGKQTEIATAVSSCYLIGNAHTHVWTFLAYLLPRFFHPAVQFLACCVASRARHARRVTEVMYGAIQQATQAYVQGHPELLHGRNLRNLASKAEHHPLPENLPAPNERCLVATLLHAMHTCALLPPAYGSLCWPTGMVAHTDAMLGLVHRCMSSRCDSGASSVSLHDKWLMCRSTHRPLQEHEVLGQLWSFFFTAHDKLVGAVCSVIFHVATHPDVERSVVAEIKRNGADCQPTVSNMHLWPYCQVRSWCDVSFARFHFLFWRASC